MKDGNRQHELIMEYGLPVRVMEPDRQLAVCCLLFQLVLIHDLIHVAEDLIDRLVRGPADKDSNAHLIERTGSAVVPAAAFLQLFHELLRNNSVINRYEFISAETINLACVLEQGSDNAGKMLQIQITGHMAVPVVDHFKMIQIHEEDGEREAFY